MTAPSDFAISSPIIGLQNRPAIDGLRAFAILSVFIYHLKHQWLPGGFVGVDVFFVISGFLITSIIIKHCNAGDFSLVEFYQRRIARIFPAFFTVALATLAGASLVYTPQDLASTGANLTAASLSLANIKYMMQGSYFAISPDAQPFLHYWSLSVEEQFYILFPIIAMLLFKFAKKRQLLFFGLLGFTSLTACIVLTRRNPAWAFYLLPTRAWELLAGCLLAVMTNNDRTLKNTKILGSASSSVSNALQLAGLAMIVASFFVIHEGPQFPGYWALLPAIGTVAVMLPQGSHPNLTEKLLASAPLVMIGQMSYSLYLWHWPVFSLVDYKLFFASEPMRLTLKIVLSLIATYLSFRLIEKPARSFLNQPKNKSMAYAAFAAVLIVCVPLGMTVRNINYVNAGYNDVAKGGLVFPGKTGSQSVVLMGDSNGSMYGKIMKEICAELGLKLTIISVAAGDPLPSSNGKDCQLWLDSLAVVENEKPDYLFLAYNWKNKLESDKNRLAIALDSLKVLSAKIVILNQPPILSESTNRENIRNGMKPPYLEDQSTQKERLASNDFLKSFASEKLVVIDIAQKFQLSGREVRFLDQQNRQLYQDISHLSGYGAELVRPMFQAVFLPDSN